MTQVTLRMRNGCIRIDDDHFIVPGLMKINATIGENNGMYLQSNDCSSTSGYSPINIINIDPHTGLDANIIVKNVEFTPNFSLLSGQACGANELMRNTITPIYTEFCGSEKGSVIGSPTCDVTICNVIPGTYDCSLDTNSIINYLPSFALKLDLQTNDRTILLWDSLQSKFVGFESFPITNENEIHYHTFQNQGIYRIEYDSDLLIGQQELLRTEISNPRNMASEINDMGNAIQTNPQNICDLLPSGI